MDAGHKTFLQHADGWPGLWPIGIFGLPELRAQAAASRLTEYLVAAGDLEAAEVSAAEVYPVAWAKTGGTAVVVRPDRERAGEVIWFEGVQSTVYSGFDVFFDAVAARLLAVAGPLVGGTEGEHENEW